MNDEVAHDKGGDNLLMATETKRKKLQMHHLFIDVIIYHIYKNNRYEQ